MEIDQIELIPLTKTGLLRTLTHTPHAHIHNTPQYTPLLLLTPSLLPYPLCYTHTHTHTHTHIYTHQHWHTRLTLTYTNTPHHTLLLLLTPSLLPCPLGRHRSGLASLRWATSLLVSPAFTVENGVSRVTWVIVILAMNLRLKIMWFGWHERSYYSFLLDIT